MMLNVTVQLLFKSRKSTYKHVCQYFAVHSHVQLVF